MTSLRAFLAALALLFCAGVAAAAPVVLHRGNGAEPDTLDPQKATGQWENNIIGDMMVGLMTDDAMGDPIAGVAESYTVSEDGLVWTFKLREDAVWSDGVPVTADDFVYAYQRINNPALGGQYATLTHVIKNAAKVYAQELPPEELGVKALAPKTLEMTLEHPAAYLPYQLAHYAMFPVPKHVVERFGDDWVKAGNYVSNGAFMFVEWRPNEFVHVKKNPRFYDAANVKVDEIYYYAQEDQLANVKRFRAGEYDLSTGIPGQQLEDLRKTIPENVRIAPFITTWYIVLNYTTDPWKDPRIGTALGMALDRELIAEKIMGAGEQPAYALVPPGIPDYPHTAKLTYAGMPLEERREKAKALLAEAGFGPDNPLTFEFIHPQSTDAKRIAVALQGMWKAIGVQMTPKGSETKDVYNNLREQTYDVGWAGWSADFPDASNYLYLAETSSVEMNYSKYSDVQFDNLNIQADSEVDGVKRGEILSQAEQVLLDAAPMIPVYFAVSRNLVGTHVKGWEDSPNNIHRSRWLSIEGERKIPGTNTVAADEGAQPTVAADAGGGDSDRPWYWWLVAIWEWFKGLLCSWFGVACPSA